MSARPRVGDRAPALELETGAGDRWRLADHLGRSVIVAFYPHDGGRLCTRQLESYAAVHRDLVAASCDDVASHQKFGAARAFPFPLLATIRRAGSVPA